jgi:hypothetical protein
VYGAGANAQAAATEIGLLLLTAVGSPPGSGSGDGVLGRPATSAVKWFIDLGRVTVKRISLCTALIAVLTLSLTIASALSATGRLQLYLVNSGPDTTFYNDSIPADGDCDPFMKPASLSQSRGTGVQVDSPGYQFTGDPADAHPTRFSYTVPSGGGFTVPANDDAVILKLWSFSGDGTCGGQNGDQTVDWRVVCSGATCGTKVSLTGSGQLGKPGWQFFDVPAGTPINSVFNNHAGPSSSVQVGAGDVITLELSADTWSAIQWSAPNGAGASSLSILRN